MRTWWSRLSTALSWVIPMILSLLPILVLGLAAGDERERIHGDLHRQLLEKCRVQGNRLQQASHLPFWSERAARLVKQRAFATLARNPALASTTAGFGRALEAAANDRRLRSLPPVEIWGAAFPGGDPENGADLCRGPRLRADFATVMGSLFQDLGRQHLVDREAWETVASEGWGGSRGGPFDSSRMRRMEATFGEGLSPDLFSESHRGKGIPVIFRGQHRLLAWDIITWRQKPVGAFLLLMPIDRNAGRTALQLTMANWSARTVLPAYLPMPMARDGPHPPPILHPRLLQEQVLAEIERFRSQMRITDGISSRGQGVSVDLLSPFLGKLVRFAPDLGLMAWFTPLDPLSGHLGMLVFRAPRLPRPFLESLARLAWMAWLAVWIMQAARAALIGAPTSGVRQETALWLLGVTAMPVVLSIGTGVQLNADLRSNRLEQMERDLSRTMADLETGFGRVNDRIAQFCLAGFRDARFSAAVRRAARDPRRGKQLLNRVIASFRKRGFPISGLLILDRGNLVLDSFAPWMAPSQVRILKNALRDGWREILSHQRGGKAPADGSRGGTEVASPLERLKSRALEMREQEERPVSWRAGSRQFCLHRTIVKENPRSGFAGRDQPLFQVTVLWTPEKLYRNYMRKALANPGLLVGKADLALAVYHSRFDDLEEIGATGNVVAGREDLRREARLGVDRPYRRDLAQGGDLIIAVPNPRLPGLVFLGRASQDLMRQELSRERVRTGGFILGLILLVAAASRLLAARLAEPVVRMTAGLQRVSTGDLEVRVAEARGDELGKAGLTLDRMTCWLAERAAMSRFVSSQVLDVVAAGNYREAMAGSQREVTLLVSDIRSFTTLSEAHPPQAIFAMLNHHMGAMTRAIQDQGGVIDRFIGDAVQAVFYGDPRDPRTTAERAIEAGIAMRQAHTVIQEERRRAGLFPYEIGIGIEDGRVVAGVMGDHQSRLDFTVLGEPLQAAADLEAASKHGSGSRIIVSETVRQAAGSGFAGQPLPSPHAGWEVAAGNAPPGRVGNHRGSMELVATLDPGDAQLRPEPAAAPAPTPAVSALPEGPPDPSLPSPPSLREGGGRADPSPAGGPEGAHSGEGFGDPATAAGLAPFGGIWTLLSLWLLPACLVFFAAGALRQSAVSLAQNEAGNRIQELHGQLEGGLTPEVQGAVLLTSLLQSWGEARGAGRLRQADQAREAMTRAFPGGTLFLYETRNPQERFGQLATDSEREMFLRDLRLVARTGSQSLPLDDGEVKKVFLVLLSMERNRSMLSSYVMICSTEWLWMWFDRFAKGAGLGNLGGYRFMRQAMAARGKLVPFSLRGHDYRVLWWPTYSQATTREGVPIGVSPSEGPGPGSPDGGSADASRPGEQPANARALRAPGEAGSRSGPLPGGERSGRSPHPGNPVQEAKLTGGMIAFLPPATMSQAGSTWLLKNLARQGFPAALVRTEGGRRRVVRTASFRRTGFSTGLGHQTPNEAWVLGSQISPGLGGARLFLASNWRQFLTPAVRTAELATWAAALWLLGGGVLLWLLRTRDRSEWLSLRVLMVGAFSLAVAPALVIGVLSVERSLLERTARLFTDHKRSLMAEVTALEDSQRLQQTFACAMLGFHLERPFYLSWLDCLETVGPSQTSFSKEPPLEELAHVLRFSGLGPQQVEVISAGGFTLGAGVKQAMLTCLKWLRIRNLTALYGAAASETILVQKPGNLLIGSQVEEFGQVMRDMLHPWTLAAWMSAPQALAVSMSSGWGEKYFYTRYLPFRGAPRWLAQVKWTQGMILTNVLREWHRYLELSGNRDLHLGVSYLEAPTWRLAPPFQAFIPEPGREAELAGMRQIPTFEAAEPETAARLLWAAESGRSLVERGGRGQNDRLFVALHARDPNGLLFSASLPADRVVRQANRNADRQREILLGLALLAGLLALGVAERFLRPLLDLAAQAHRIMRLDFTARLPVQRDDEFGSLARAFNGMAEGVEQGRLLRQFVSDSVAVASADRDRETAARAGESLEVAVLFVGLGEFKPLLKKIAPSTLVSHLNLFLERAAASVRRHGGEVDKFIGEKILAVFHPRVLGSLEAAQAAALRASFEIRAAKAELAFWAGKPLGAGLVAGPVLAGILGTPEVRLEYTVIGDTVNLAARLCDLALKEGGGIVIERESLARAGAAGDQRFQPLGEVALKGKTRKVSCLIARSGDGR